MPSHARFVCHPPMSLISSTLFAFRSFEVFPLRIDLFIATIVFSTHLDRPSSILSRWTALQCPILLCFPSNGLSVLPRDKLSLFPRLPFRLFFSFFPKRRAIPHSPQRMAGIITDSDHRSRIYRRRCILVSAQPFQSLHRYTCTVLSISALSAAPGHP